MYDHNAACYTVQDLGSQNGTFLNDLRLSQVITSIPVYTNLPPLNSACLGLFV